MYLQTVFSTLDYEVPALLRKHLLRMKSYKLYLRVHGKPHFDTMFTTSKVHMCFKVYLYANKSLILVTWRGSIVSAASERPGTLWRMVTIVSDDSSRGIT
jgi:hypothetical protein